MSSVGKVLRRLRKAHKLTAGDAARVLGCTQVFVAQVERGERPCPWDREQLDKLAELVKDETKELLCAALRDRLASLLTPDECQAVVDLIQESDVCPETFECLFERRSPGGAKR